MSAQKMQVDVRRARYDLPKSPDGVRTISTLPLVVSFHYYSLIVDGVVGNDPGSYTFFGTGKDTSRPFRFGIEQFDGSGQD
jgi:hypothetical protein